MKGLRDDEGRNTARTPQPENRSAAPVDPVALPPAGEQVNGGGPATGSGPAGGTVGGQPGGSVRRDADR
jgi:hypothetical protein